MTKTQVEIAAAALAGAIHAELPHGMSFALIVCANGEPGEGTVVHTSSATNLSGADLAFVLSQILHTVEVHAEAIKAGATLDLTPRGVS